VEIVLANLYQTETEPGVVQEAVAEEETTNPILPTGNELFWGAVCFALLWALMKWVLLPPITRTMERRAAKVRGDLEAAESTQAKAAAELREYEDSLVSAKAEAVRIIEDARRRADEERKGVIAAAEADAAAVRADAANEIAAAKERAKADLRGSVASIAVQAAESVVQKQLDRDAALRAVDDYVNRAGSPN
jgi:F-type H+-transporting ATPase subunit b